MKNEFGKNLDKAGYAPSIIPGHSPCVCWLCGRNGGGKMDRHEIFGGPYRSKSKRLGLWVHLCHSTCHQGPQGVHADAATADALKKKAQIMCFLEYGWGVEKFISEFGRNHI